MLKLYADESGSADPTGKQYGSKVPVLCGFIASSEKWVSFCPKWKAILNDYRAPYFHFREFATKALYMKPQSPYYGWNDSKRRAFLYDLAFLAGETAVPVGGFHHAKEHYNRKLEGHPYRYVVQAFHNDVVRALSENWPNCKGKDGSDQVLFIFDETSNKDWIHALRETHATSKQADARFGELTFGDDKQHLPLQAADLYAYATRQQAERYMESGKQLQPMRVLDLLCNKRIVLWPKRNESIAALAWKQTMHLMIKDEKRQKAAWEKSGLPKKQYIPELHFPFEKYGIPRSPKK